MKKEPLINLKYFTCDVILSGGVLTEICGFCESREEFKSAMYKHFEDFFPSVVSIGKVHEVVNKQIKV